MFDIALEDEIKPGRRGDRGFKGADRNGGPNAKRQKKNEKFGFGGKKKHSKSNDVLSTSDMRDFSVKKMKGKDGGGKKRLGKSKRAKGRG
jgi:rRNA-processing protein EBP2